MEANFRSPKTGGRPKTAKTRSIPPNLRHFRSNFDEFPPDLGYLRSNIDEFCLCQDRKGKFRVCPIDLCRGGGAINRNEARPKKYLGIILRSLVIMFPGLPGLFNFFFGVKAGKEMMASFRSAGSFLVVLRHGGLRKLYKTHKFLTQNTAIFE